jgi:hypothetical protein
VNPDILLWIIEYFKENFLFSIVMAIAQCANCWFGPGLPTPGGNSRLQQGIVFLEFRNWQILAFPNWQGVKVNLPCISG